MNNWYNYFKVFDLPQASNWAGNVDSLYDFIFWLTAVGFLGVVIPMIIFSIKYHRSRSNPDTTPMIEGHTPSELGISFGLLVLVMLLFYWGWKDYDSMFTMPADAYEIKVVGEQWRWSFIYPNGRKETDLVVPQDRNVKLLMTSKDVIHSFFVPDFRVKQDVLPNMYTNLWFRANQQGEYQVFCAEFCGTLHSSMLSKVQVKAPQEFDDWLKSGAKDQAATEDPVKKGEALFKAQNCFACHSMEPGKVLVGPPLAGIFGREEVLTNGNKVKVDENYIRESLTDPQAKIVKGFDKVPMPPFKGVLKDKDIDALISYLKSVPGQ